MDTGLSIDYDLATPVGLFRFHPLLFFLGPGLKFKKVVGLIEQPRLPRSASLFIVPKAIGLIKVASSPYLSLRSSTPGFQNYYPGFTGFGQLDPDPGLATFVR